MSQQTVTVLPVIECLDRAILQGASKGRAELPEIVQGNQHDHCSVLVFPTSKAPMTHEHRSTGRYVEHVPERGVFPIVCEGLAGPGGDII